MTLLLMVLFWLAHGLFPPSPIHAAVQARAVEQDQAGALWHNVAPYPAAYGPLCGVGEIIARGYGPAEALLAWQASPPHAAVINTGWTHAAAGRSGNVIVVAFVRDC